jgi:hypothetical protein
VSEYRLTGDVSPNVEMLSAMNGGSMAQTIGYIVESSNERKPFKVVFRCGEKIIAEHDVASRLSGEELIERLLPTLQGYDPDA